MPSQGIKLKLKKFEMKTEVVKLYHFLQACALFKDNLSVFLYIHEQCEGIFLHWILGTECKISKFANVTKIGGRT